MIRVAQKDCPTYSFQPQADTIGVKICSMSRIMRHRGLITSPLAWQMAAAPVAPPLIPVLAERGGTQLKTPHGTVLVDTREQNPFDFSRFSGWFTAVKKKALSIGDYTISG